jgi:hypothetical protein
MHHFNNWDGIQRTHLEEATQSTIGKYRFTPFTEGSIKGWTISIQGTGQVGYIQEPAKKNTKTTFSPYKIYRSKGANSAFELKMSALPGTETRIINDKEVRFAPRQLLKAVAMWMDKYGKVMTEATEVVAEVAVDGAQPLNEEYFELDDMADNIRKTADKPMKSSEVSTYLKQIAGSLRLAHQQNQDFLKGLLYHLEGIHKKSGSPSKHGNMEIMRDLQTVIRELKKYKKV